MSIVRGSEGPLKFDEIYNYRTGFLGDADNLRPLPDEALAELRQRAAFTAGWTGNAAREIRLRNSRRFGFVFYSATGLASLVAGFVALEDWRRHGGTAWGVVALIFTVLALPGTAVGLWLAVRGRLDDKYALEELIRLLGWVRRLDERVVLEMKRREGPRGRA